MEFKIRGCLIFPAFFLPLTSLSAAIANSVMLVVVIPEDEACLMALKSVGDELRSADAMPSSHPLFPEVSKICEDRIGILRDGFPSCDGEVGSVNNGWTVLAKQGEMTIYNREVESSDGTYLDPLQVFLIFIFVILISKYLQ